VPMKNIAVVSGPSHAEEVALERLSYLTIGAQRLSLAKEMTPLFECRFIKVRISTDIVGIEYSAVLKNIYALAGGICNGLGYGDLYVLAGTVAIRSMGGPVLGFCAGRVDVQDNSQTLALGPSPEQDKFAHCEVPGACPFPLGQNTLGLVYVNPEGPFGEPDLVGAAQTIRDVFGRMEWQGREVVALIGGGHTFGKTHGASNSSNGEVPAKCPFASWNGPKGMDAITSGFEGPW